MKTFETTPQKDRLWGQDIEGRAFNGEARFSKSGVDQIKVTNFAARVAIGETLGAVVNGHKGRLRVADCKAGAWGYELLLTPIGFLMPDLAFTPTEVEPVTERPERRAYKRVAAAGTAWVSLSANQPPSEMKFTDISEGGCYIETFSPAPVGEHTFVRLQSGSLECAAECVVRSSHHHMGMGVQFVRFQSEQDRLGLQRYVRSLGGGIPESTQCEDPTASDHVLAAVSSLRALVQEAAGGAPSPESLGQLQFLLHQTRKWIATKCGSEWDAAVANWKLESRPGA